MNLDTLTGSYPNLKKNNISPEDWKWFESLPVEYKDFLQSTKGGFVEEFRYTFLTGVPYKTEQINNTSRNDCPIEFYGIPTNEYEGDTPDDLLQVAVNNEAEEFLPSNIIAIARCVQSSLVCISIEGEDKGAIYYWDWYWRYPWCKEFFESRINRAINDFENIESILNGRKSKQYQKASDALNYATLTYIAPSFNNWINNCQVERENT